MFRFFECLHTAWDTRAADTSENNIGKLFYLKANSWLNIFFNIYPTQKSAIPVIQA